MSPRLAPPKDEKKCLVILILRRFRGGPVKGFMEVGGGQSRDIFRGGPVKKTPCTSDTSNAGNSSDASKTSASETRLSSFFFLLTD